MDNVFYLKQLGEMLMGDQPPAPNHQRKFYGIYLNLIDLQASLEEDGETDNSLYRATKAARVHLSSCADLYK